MTAYAYNDHGQIVLTPAESARRLQLRVDDLTAQVREARELYDGAREALRRAQEYEDTALEHWCDLVNRLEQAVDERDGKERGE